MNHERKSKVYEYIKGYARFKKAVKNAPKEAYQFRPSDDAWTIHEIVIHVAEAEIVASVRLRKLIAEPGITLELYDQNTWAEKLLYHEQSIKVALKMLKYMRMANEELMVTLPDSAWENKVIHPESGEKDIDRWLDLYINHVDSHARQIERNIESFNKEAQVSSS